MKFPAWVLLPPSVSHQIKHWKWKPHWGYRKNPLYPEIDQGSGRSSELFKDMSWSLIHEFFETRACISLIFDSLPPSTMLCTQEAVRNTCWFVDKHLYVPVPQRSTAPPLVQRLHPDSWGILLHFDVTVVTWCVFCSNSVGGVSRTFFSDLHRIFEPFLKLP